MTTTFGIYNSFLTRRSRNNINVIILSVILSRRIELKNARKINRRFDTQGAREYLSRDVNLKIIILILFKSTSRDKSLDCTLINLYPNDNKS